MLQYDNKSSALDLKTRINKTTSVLFPIPERTSSASRVMENATHKDLLNGRIQDDSERLDLSLIQENRSALGSASSLFDSSASGRT